MKRTTLALDADLLRQLKSRAAEADTTLQALANDLLRRALVTPPDRRRYKLRLPAPWRAEVQPGVDFCDRDKLFDLMDGR